MSQECHADSDYLTVKQPKSTFGEDSHERSSSAVPLEHLAHSN